MRKNNSGKNNITLCLRVPKDEAVRIIGNLWARGFISDNQYIHKLENIDADEAIKFAEKRMKLRKTLNGYRGE